MPNKIKSNEFDSSLVLSVAGVGLGGRAEDAEEIRTSGTSMFIGLAEVWRRGGSIIWVVTRRGDRIGRRAQTAYT